MNNNKEALERAREVYKKFNTPGFSCSIEDLEYIFPELSSEVENIELTDFESELFTVVSFFWQSYNQGESIDLVSFVKEFSPQLLEVIHRENSKKWDDHQNKLLNYAISMTDDEEVKNFLESIRGINNFKWDIEDINTKNKIIGSLDALKFYIERNSGFSTERIESNLKEIDEEIKWLEYIEPQPKQNLTEENRKIIDGLISMLSQDLELHKKEVKFLKSL